jgi:hypothetical protein
MGSAGEPSSADVAGTEPLAIRECLEPSGETVLDQSPAGQRREVALFVAGLLARQIECEVERALERARRFRGGGAKLADLTSKLLETS